jgi:predicted hydrocarbon binding protein
VHGIVFEELREFVWRTHGAEEWASLLAVAAPGRRFYAPDTGYPDEELEALLAESTKRTGASRGDLLREFGTFIAPTLLELYRPLVSEQWGLLDLLEHVEETIHRVVRLDDPTAMPPRLHFERPDESRVVLHYNSERKMCDLAKGIILGLQQEYAEEVSITERACMLRGDPECTVEFATGA